MFNDSCVIRLAPLAPAACAALNIAPLSLIL